MDDYQGPPGTNPQPYLENIKTRLVQLQESIHFFLRSINPETTPGTVSWNELHSKFNVLIAKYLHLTNILNDPRLLISPCDYTIFPFEPPANDQQVQNLSVLLRTKLFPELEQADEERTKEGTIPGLPVLGPSNVAVKGVVKVPGVMPTPVGNPEEKKVWNAYKLKIAMHDALCKKADELFEEQRDMVHTKVRYESDDDEDEDEVQNGATKRDRDASGGAMGQGSNKKLKLDTNPLPTDEFLGGTSASIRYVDEWAGSLNETDGYSSGADEHAGDAGAGVAEGEELYDDSYFEARRREGALNDDDDEDDESSEEELESVHDEEHDAEIQGDEADESEDEDTFMEVVSPNVPFNLQAAAGSNAGMAASVVETFEEDDDDEEDMEEVV
ncbi:hypothetical protein BGX33_009005 [Mortierella sp. NVP41]|nr:hypothetical protein BGX33_009005 [Mortierella sp. NVP41]